MLSKVKYSWNNKFNLFSVTNLLLNRWYIGGYRDATLLRKNEQTINFYIKIKTKEGIIFATYVNREFSTK